MNLLHKTEEFNISRFENELFLLYISILIDKKQSSLMNISKRFTKRLRLNLHYCISSFIESIITYCTYISYIIYFENSHSLKIRHLCLERSYFFRIFFRNRSRLSRIF